MKDKWINLNEDPIKPYVEPSVEFNDPKTIESLLLLNFKLSDIELSLSKKRFDEIYSTYLLLQISKNRFTPKPESAYRSLRGVATSLVETTESEITTKDGLKGNLFTNKLEDEKVVRRNVPPSPETVSNNFKRQLPILATIEPESLKERNTTQMASTDILRPVPALTPKAITDRGLAKSPVKPLRAFKPDTSFSTTSQTTRRLNMNVYKKAETTKDTPLVPCLNAAPSNSSSSSIAFTRNGPSRYTFHSGESRSHPRENSSLESKAETSAFGKGNFLQRLTRFSKRFRLPQGKTVVETTTKN